MIYFVIFPDIGNMRNGNWGISGGGVPRAMDFVWGSTPAGAIPLAIVSRPGATPLAYLLRPFGAAMRRDELRPGGRGGLVGFGNVEWAFGMAYAESPMQD